MDLVYGQAVKGVITVKNVGNRRGAMTVRGEILSGTTRLAYLYDRAIGGTPSAPEIGPAQPSVMRYVDAGQTLDFTLYSPPLGATGYLSVKWTVTGDDGRNVEKTDTNVLHCLSPGEVPGETPGGWVPNMPMLYGGHSGEYVLLLQQRLRDLGYDPGGIDGQFGIRTETAVKDYQQAKGLSIDGVVGPLTWRALLSPPPQFPVLRSGSTGPYVFFLQRRLRDKGYTVQIDGVFGANTQAVLRSFQESHGLSPTGVLDDDDWFSLFQ